MNFAKTAAEALVDEYAGLPEKKNKDNTALYGTLAGLGGLGAAGGLALYNKDAISDSLTNAFGTQPGMNPALAAGLTWGLAPAAGGATLNALANTKSIRRNLPWVGTPENLDIGAKALAARAAAIQAAGDKYNPTDPEHINNASEQAAHQWVKSFAGPEKNKAGKVISPGRGGDLAKYIAESANLPLGSKSDFSGLVFGPGKGQEVRVPSTNSPWVKNPLKPNTWLPMVRRRDEDILDKIVSGLSRPESSPGAGNGGAHFGAQMGIKDIPSAIEAAKSFKNAPSAAMNDASKIMKTLGHGAKVGGSLGLLAGVLTYLASK